MLAEHRQEDRDARKQREKRRVEEWSRDWQKAKNETTWVDLLTIAAAIALAAYLLWW